jgi:hypothetical protein
MQFALLILKSQVINLFCGHVCTELVTEQFYFYDCKAPDENKKSFLLHKMKLFELHENLISFPVGFSSTTNNPLLPLIDKVLGRLNSAGIFQYIKKLYFEETMAKASNEVLNHTKVLTLGDLSFGFVIWLGACILSALGYVLEALYFEFNFKRN